MQNTDNIKKIEDYPCFYYVDKYGTRQEKVQVFCGVTYALGFNKEDTAQKSRFFVDALKLFNKPFSIEEIDEYAKDIFSNEATSPCDRNRQMDSWVENDGLRKTACLVCPYSSIYKNRRIEEEYTACKCAMSLDVSKCLSELHSGIFKSYEPLNQDNNTVLYPAIPFTQLLFDYLKVTIGISTFNINNVINRVQKYVKKHNPDVPLDVINNFVNVKMAAINSKNVNELIDQVISTELQLRYQAHPKAFPLNARTEQDLSAFLNSDSLTTKKENVATTVTTDSPTDVSDNKIIKKTRTRKRKTESEPSENAQVNFLDFLGNNDTSSTDNEPSATSDVTFEAKTPDNSIDSFGKVSPSSDENVGFYVTAEMTPREVDDYPSTENDASETPDLIEDATEDEESTSKEDSELMEQPTPSDSIESEEANKDKAAEPNDSVVNAISDQPLLLPFNLNPCELCDGGACTYSELSNSLTGAEKRFFLEAIKPLNADFSHPKNFSKLYSTYGCGLNNSPEPHCIYQQVRILRSQNSIEILPCLDMCKTNYLDFLEDSCTAHEICIERVTWNYIDGLLFYVNNKYYFFSTYYAYVYGLKPLLQQRSSNDVTLLSLNPVFVYEALENLGFKKTIIESVAGLYSVCHNLNIIAPVGAIFNKYMPFTYSSSDYLLQIMPYYSKVYKECIESPSYKEPVIKKAYKSGQRLERTLGKNTSALSFSETERAIYGGNFLQYAFSAEMLKTINRTGTLYTLSVANREELEEELAQPIFHFYELLASDIYLFNSPILEYAHLVGLNNDYIAFYVTFDEETFYDYLLDRSRKIYSKTFHDAVPRLTVNRKKVK